jgi:predicted ribosomally synthesized peptide with SipW-like signal peptide
MKKKIILSTLVILVVLAASLGATFAWFTDQSEEIENVFTAGTVSLNAGEEWAYGTGLENWNPGDCTDKEIYLEYTGSKKAFLRMQIEEAWQLVDPDWDGTGDVQYLEAVEYFGRDALNVDWKANGVDWNDAGEWVYFDGWWYYNGDDDTYTHVVDGQTLNAVSGDQDPIEKITIITQVCLNGPDTGNDYQGAKYTLEVVFQAIQASHSEDWQWDNVDFETGLVE